MKAIVAAAVSALLMGFGIQGWAGPAEEVAQISAPRLKALFTGDIDGYVEAFADNAVLYSSFSPFRIEGKEAIRAFFNQLVQMYPRRNVQIRQPVSRVYNDNVVIQTSYATLNWVNAKGEYEIYDTRGSTVWTKVDGQWKIVDQHLSRLPAHGED